MNKLSTHLLNQGFFGQPDAEMYTKTSRCFLNCVSDLKQLSENVRPSNRLGANTGPLKIEKLINPQNPLKRTSIFKKTFMNRVSKC